ncbi:MAG: fasciclin domain-containing protein [Chloroflexota bacterium]
MKRFSGILLAMLLVVSAFPVFAQDDEMSNTIADIVVASAEAEEPEFTTLLTAVGAADPAVLEALANPEAELTVFAPTDAAFAALAEALGEEVFGEILADPVALTEILLYHVVEGTVMSGDVVAALTPDMMMEDDMGDEEDMDDEDMMSMETTANVVTLSDQFITIAGTLTEEDEVDLEAGITVDGANLVLEMVDIEADNGVIHVIDAVLVPELNTIAEIVVASTEAEEAEFTTLLTAVTAADPAVLELLSDPSAGLTVFAPTDAAFEAVEGLEDIVADTELLTAILQYHVVADVVYSFDIPGLLGEDGTVGVEMADGSTATISVTEEGVFINDAQVVLTDIEASNGTIHVIDAVIVPPME